MLTCFCFSVLWSSTWHVTLLHVSSAAYLIIKCLAVGLAASISFLFFCTHLLVQ